MKIFLIRHGQTIGDIEDRYGGNYDDHLSQEGQLQVIRLARQLPGSGIKIIYCSPKIRAQETAMGLKDVLNCSIETVDDLRERNQYGVLTGMVKAEAKEKFPELTQKVKDYRNTLPEGESYEDFKKRILSIWDNLLNSKFETIAILTHGGPIKVIFREILAKEVKIEDCGYAIFEKDSLGLSLIRTEGIKEDK